MYAEAVCVWLGSVGAESGDAVSYWRTLAVLA